MTARSDAPDNESDREPSLEGEILRSGDPGYEEAREVWNARFDRRPQLIVRARGPDDVAAALEHARQSGLAVAVKSGGHGYAGHSACEGGLLLDLGPLDSVSIEPDRRRATVGAGVRWADLDEAAAAHGLATTGGTVSTVGVAGLTLGGGEGWLSRKHGHACDNLRAAEVVTAEGEIVRASGDENPDLLWALRGGGGNFGVVTSFELALHPLDHEIVGGQVVYPLARAAEVLRRYRDFFLDAPDEAACFPFFYRVPPLEIFPEASHGDVVISLVLAWMGRPDEAEEGLAPLREIPGPIVDAVLPQPYEGLQRSFDAGMGKGNRWYSRAHYFDALTDECIDVLIRHLDPFPGELTAVYFATGGGAAGRVAPDSAAYPHRTARHGLHVFPGWADPASDDEIMIWARRVSDAVAPYASGGVYVNLLAEDEPSRVRAAYGPNRARLAEIKRKWDPRNVFRSNHNIPPR